jgi:hypothetical protein
VRLLPASFTLKAEIRYETSVYFHLPDVTFLKTVIFIFNIVRAINATSVEIFEISGNVGE